MQVGVFAGSVVLKVSIILLLTAPDRNHICFRIYQSPFCLSWIVSDDGCCLVDVVSVVFSVWYCWVGWFFRVLICAGCWEILLRRLTLGRLSRMSQDWGILGLLSLREDLYSPRSLSRLVCCTYICYNDIIIYSH